MAKLWRIRVTTAAAFVFAASAANVVAGGAHAATAGEKTAPVGPTQVVLLSLETSAYRAWKSKDERFWKAFLSDKFVGWGSSGRLDKTSATKEYSGANCEIKSFAISNMQTSPLGQDAALITHKTIVSGTCDGQKYPPGSWAASVYVRDGNRWKVAFHAEAAIVDPAAPATRPDAEKAMSPLKQTRRIDRDAHTDALLALEKAVWEAWKDHDPKRLNALTATNMQFINIFGIHLATKPEAVKNWSGEGCNVKSVDLTDAAATMISPTVGILTFHASADGTCFGQKVGPIWGSSIYVRDGDTWKWNFGINLPARLEGG